MRVINSSEMPANADGRFIMSDTYIIEVHSAAAGLVLRDHGGFRFFSANAAFAALDGLLFNDPTDAERAALRHCRIHSRQATAQRARG